MITTTRRASSGTDYLVTVAPITIDDGVTVWPLAEGRSRCDSGFHGSVHNLEAHYFVEDKNAGESFVLCHECVSNYLTHD